MKPQLPAFLYVWWVLSEWPTTHVLTDHTGRPAACKRYALRDDIQISTSRCMISRLVSACSQTLICDQTGGLSPHVSQSRYKEHVSSSAPLARKEAPGSCPSAFWYKFLISLQQQRDQQLMAQSLCTAILQNIIPEKASAWTPAKGIFW